MVLVLSGIFYCVWIISVRCVCKGATSDGVGLVEESAKEGELDYSEGTWREKAQNNKIGDDNLFDTHIEGKEGGVGETLKEERMLKKCTKQWNEGGGEIGKCEKWGFCDEWKMWGKEGACGGSGVEGSVVGVNSSLKLNSLGLREMGGESVLRASDGSFVEVSGCVVGVERETPPFDFCGSCGLFTNISLKSSSTSTSSLTEQIFPPLFSSKAVEGEIPEKCHISVCSSHFSSFCVSSATFISSHFVSLSQLEFFNISTNPQKTTHLGEGLSERVFLMSGCSFSSVWDVYDGGIVPSLNSPSSSLDASNTSFARCYRSGNVAISGSEGNPSKPARQQIADNGANSFTWCVWNGSSATGTSGSFSDGTSNGGAIYMNDKASGTLSVKFCSFNDCYAHYGGGGIFCHSINSVKIENNSFNACTAKKNEGGGMYSESISSCFRISGCEFQNCEANDWGGGLYFQNFNALGTECFETESGKGESACVFECCFTSCALTGSYGGGIGCQNVPTAFNMRSVQFISCSAASYGGGLFIVPYQSEAPINNTYCYFFFFHDCSCNASTPYGHDVCFQDYYNIFKKSNNPFYESYTTNTNEKRICYTYLQSTSYVFQHTEKKDWLKEGMKDRYVGVGGDDANNLCGMSEAAPCKTVGHAVGLSMAQLSSTITLLGGKHVSEGVTISVEEKKISVLGKGKTVSVIGTSELSSTSTTLFGISTGQLVVGHVGIDHNATRSPSPSVFVVSLGSGTLLLEDVVLNSSTSGGSVISASVFEVALKQLKTIDVEIENIKILQPLFSEPLSAGSSSGESLLGNVTIRNVNRTEGDGVVMAKSVKGGETFVVWNTTIEECVCKTGNGGGIFACLQGSGKFDVNGTSVIDGNKAENNGGSGGNGGRGGGMFVLMESGGCGLTIGQNVKFSKDRGNVAEYGKDVFVDCGSGVFLESKVNTSSFAFFDTSTIPSDVLRLSGSEDGNESGVIPLFVYLCTMGTKVIVDGSGGNGKDHDHCGFEGFGCLTIDYCANSRLSSTVNEIEVVSSSSITKEITGPTSFGVIISGRIVSSSSEDGERMGVNVSDGRSATQDRLVGCSSSLTMRRLSFVVKGQLKARRSAFIHSTSTLSVTNCSVSFENGALTDGKIGYSIIEMAGGNLIVDGFVMESGVTLKMNGKSPITMTSGVQLEILNSRVSGVEVEVAGGNGGGGCLNVGMGVNGNVKIEESNFSSRCSGGNGMKGGGMMISVGSGGTLRVKGVKLSGCVVPSEDVENGGRGMGGGMFAELADQMGTFSLESMTFSECNAWKGKNLFEEAQDLRTVINSTSIGFNPEIGIKVADLNELCGRERNKPELIVPLVVFLRTFSSPAYVSGREQGSEFRLCGYEDYPCRTIGEASEYRYPISKRMIRLTSTFSFDEEVQLDGQPYEFDSSNKDVGIKIEATETKTQEALVMNSVSSTLTGILFELGGSIGERSSFVHSSGGTLRFADCGIKMGNGVNSANYVFASASGGKVEIFGMKCGGNVGEVRFVGSVIVVNGSCECLMDEVVVNRTGTNEVSGLIEIATNSSVTIKNCSVLNCDLPSCGAIQIEKCSSITLKNTSFENITRGAGDGGCLCLSSNVDGSKNTMRIENCTFLECEVRENGKRGGGLLVSLENPSELYVSSTRFEKCCAPSTSGSEGKGGGIFLSLVDADARFELSGDLIFDGNEAEYGKNMFILGKDFNSSVTNETFAFDYSSMIDDKTLFAGSDDFHEEKDLFMFLVSYSSFEIFISSEGFDVARCGSEEEPCQTMWKGMENMKEGNGKKTIQIEGSTVIQDSFNLSNYQIKKSVKMGEENVKAILNFEKAIGSQLEYFMVNDEHLELTNIQLQLASGFDNSAKTIISNINGDLVATGCSFHSEAEVNNGFDCVFVDAIGGGVEVNDLSMELYNVGNSIFVIHDSGITCHFVNVRVESLNESRGCILSIKEANTPTKINEECVNIEIDNSSFSGVKRSDNGASILESASENKIYLVVNSSNITEDKAELSEKGGAIFFTLGASGSMKMIDSTISHCSCSNSTGKGGGVYLETKERGDLNFTFVGMKFSSNTARVGNDIFIECFNIPSQINESQFQFDLRENHYSRINAIYGGDSCEYPNDTNLIEFVTIHQSDTIIVSSVNGSNEKQCGTNDLPCYSIEHGLVHLTSEYVSQIFIVEESVIGREINLEEMSLSSKNREMCKVEVKSNIERTKDSLISTRETVSLVRVNFVFNSYFISSHESLISPEGGILEIINCSFSSKQSNEEGNAEYANIPFHIIQMRKGELQLDGCTISNLILQKSSIYLSSSLPSVIYLFEISNSTIKTSLINIKECGQLTTKDFNAENISVEGNEESLISCLTMKKTIQLTNCTMGGVSSKTTKGKLMKLEDCLDVKMDSCIFNGNSKGKNEKNSNTEEDICKWDGSLVDVVKSSVMMKDTTISNSPEGGITMSGREMTVNDGRFENNNPFIEGYPSLRRNIICSDSGTLNVMSLKGGDGVLPNTSLWMLNEGCSFEGIASERDSSFFIPVLESVETKEEANRMKLTFKGMLLIPCNLSFSIVKSLGEEKEIEKHDFDSNGFLSEREVEGSVAKDFISNYGDEIEVSMYILFGNTESPASTGSIILKNKSEIESKAKGDERIVEGGKEGKSYWIIIVVVLVVILLVVLIGFVIFVVRWRKAKEEAKKYKEIVDDNIKKDPKAFEMVTMDMSHEEQWRRAEKKNEENAKKRVFVKTMVHSESEEYLLAESGSTEYILGKDSGKIPDWALEKVDEKEEEEEVEELRKRSPSLSLSSTGTETSYVQIEDVSPTTSSMSNLVDAMACSSPFEKLIVDLRDSLFMLLHGRNEKKEMEIESLEQREMTSALVLFWVANGALHSFDEMEVPLSSLENLSPHIVLFGEGMVISIALHSDCSSDDDSDSSSISSASTSDCSSVSNDDRESVPSPAFEDEPDNWKECLRWKAPELLGNKNMEATRQSVVFSIGIMLWECLSLQIPFGEYSAEVAGWKIKEGELPNMCLIERSSLGGIVRCCTSREAAERMGLADLKREFIQRFPAGAAILTISDSIIEEGETYDDGGGGRGDCGEVRNMAVQGICEVERAMKEEGKEDVGEEVARNGK
ncbi:uncharacterized protein MONOS_3932 [Monocercomonoides exilis]|uniref:uncharacterized protein n=1 Tax=Monocercomonoides exilis TaxID=2049356 RepID=UPI003559FE6B|nr:hypothetical protein MONOS_3932 [Monocercomonoides exilis]|eukprot:MONOS_3932.1-p1 / transcript=MONOS_3932.1 / gene=MONOS_3932 / organism=Monocercomonoides_exilis_PA203 / gene_product=unspecified product / transcript_product=unspecified product / location=Mono_scaffold00098:25391-34717(-) / protein_length=3108 / sequence_SO=supercontig / SO=protein_coding / is_pseudo=false